MGRGNIVPGYGCVGGQDENSELYVCRVLMCLKTLMCVILFILLLISITSFIVPNNDHDINIFLSVVALCTILNYLYMVTFLSVCLLLWLLLLSSFN